MAVVDTTGYFLPFDPTSNDEGYLEGCFGWVNGTLYLGDVHHAVIMAGLVQGEFGQQYDWEGLMNAKQMWGWWGAENQNYTGGWGYDEDEQQLPPKWTGHISFSTDDAKQSYGVKAKVAASFKEAFPGINWQMNKGIGGTTQKYYGDRARQQYTGEDVLNPSGNAYRYEY